MRKIAFITYSFTSFIKQDYEILSKYYDVEHITFSISLKGLYNTLKAIKRCDVTFSWFANTGAFFTVIMAKIFSKKSIVVAGGFDVANESKINYGTSNQNIFRRTLRTLSLIWADIVLPVSQSTKEETKQFTKNNVQMVYNGIDCKKFKPKGIKENLVLTIGSKIKLKGLNTFVEVAKECPDINFLIIGLSKSDLEYVPDNLILIKEVSHDAIISYCQKALVYCQLSYIESFGMALAEAMACGCIPIVTNRGALPEIVGVNGFYVSYGDIDNTVNAIREAFKENNFNPCKQIKDNFLLQKREQKLKNIIEKLMN